MATSLKERIENYAESTNFKILPKLPLIISVNGRSFSKNTSLINKPFCSIFHQCMISTMTKLCTEIDGALFAFQHNDEITIIARNDQNADTTPWYDNKIQNICSVVSAIATMQFNVKAEELDLNLMGEPIFITHVNPVPSITEAINSVIYCQQHNSQISIQFACFYEMIKKYDKPTIKEMISGLGVDERIQLLKQECNIDYYQYPAAFRRGSAAYKVPKLIDGVMKNKWAINHDLPIFTKNQDFLNNILTLGHDIYRADK